MKSLAERVQATVSWYLPSDEHQRLLEAAGVYAIAPQEGQISCGQTRVMNAIGAGTPIVATEGHGFQGYLKDRETALLVPVGDLLALRQEAESLLANREEGSRCS